MAIRKNARESVGAPQDWLLKGSVLYAVDTRLRDGHRRSMVGGKDKIKVAFEELRRRRPELIKEFKFKDCGTGNAHVFCSPIVIEELIMALRPKTQEDRREIILNPDTTVTVSFTTEISKIDDEAVLKQIIRKVENEQARVLAAERLVELAKRPRRILPDR